MNNRIKKLMPDIYDILEREFLAGVHTVLSNTGYDTLVFTGISVDGDESYTRGENNIYELAFCSDFGGVMIAEECGYTNPAHFMRQFRERKGMSAGQYRKAEKNE